MDFEVFTTNVDLQDIPSYTTNITLEGQLLKISFVWNERIGKRTIFIRNSADVCYLQNTILHPNESFELNSNAIFDDLHYKVVLQKVGDTNKVGNIYNWSKDFILCFYRTVDVETEKLNVKYGVTAPSTPTLPKPFGNWILNQGYELVNEAIRYTAYKTNGVSYYDSFANFDLVTALVTSFHDLELQQYTAFKTAVEQLIGDVDWVIDPANNQIKYKVPISDPYSPQNQYIYSSVYAGITDSTTLQGAVDLASSRYCEINNYTGCTGTVISQTSSSTWEVRFCRTGPSSDCLTNNASRVVNPAYDPNAEQEESSIPLETVAQKVISNAESNPDEILKMLSEDYINIVANSIFGVNTSKQFVKLEDLIPQLEVNKVLR